MFYTSLKEPNLTQSFNEHFAERLGHRLPFSAGVGLVTSYGLDESAVGEWGEARNIQPASQPANTSGGPFRFFYICKSFYYNHVWNFLNWANKKNQFALCGPGWEDMTQPEPAVTQTQQAGGFTPHRMKLFCSIFILTESFVPQYLLTLRSGRKDIQTWCEVLATQLG